MDQDERRNRMIKARDDLYNALTEMVRMSREDEEGYLFVQDWAIVCASESMEPGKENFTFTNVFARPGMSQYAVVGLHEVASHSYMNAAKLEM